MNHDSNPNNSNTDNNKPLAVIELEYPFDDHVFRYNPYNKLKVVAWIAMSYCELKHKLSSMNQKTNKHDSPNTARYFVSDKEGNIHEVSNSTSYIKEVVNSFSNNDSTSPILRSYDNGNVLIYISRLFMVLVRLMFQTSKQGANSPIILRSNNPEEILAMLLVPGYSLDYLKRLTKYIHYAAILTPDEIKKGAGEKYESYLNIVLEAIEYYRTCIRKTHTVATEIAIIMTDFEKRLRRNMELVDPVFVVRYATNMPTFTRNFTNHWYQNLVAPTLAEFEM